jgi:transketolase
MRALPMRQIFGRTLVELADRVPALVVLDADVSSSTQTCLFAAKAPDRFFNFGIAEANMIAAAAGMAACGLVPVVSTFAFLMALRAGDAVRSLVAYSGLGVKMAGGYAGLSDFADGASHQSVCDMSVMTGIPGITVIAPSDAVQTRAFTEAMLAHPGPVYLRLSRAEVDSAYPEGTAFTIGKGIVRRDGTDVTLVSCGTMLGVVERAADALASRGVSVRVVDMPTVKPLDTGTVLRAARETGALVTIEEHTIHGGLGSAVAAAVGEAFPVPVVRCGIPDRFGESGAYHEILARAGLGVDDVVEKAARAMGMKRQRA